MYQVWEHYWNPEDGLYEDGVLVEECATLNGAAATLVGQVYDWTAETGMNDIRSGLVVRYPDGNVVLATSVYSAEGNPALLVEVLEERAVYVYTPHA